ncbi:MAG: hypothetical protein IJV44_12560 [Prevotella sp.]|nr:hypothetical protein [Prevotella sp.]
MNEVYVIRIEDGSEYKLQFTSEGSGLIASDLLNSINAQGIEVVEIGLARVKGNTVTGTRVLAQIEKYIAEMLFSHPNVIISFFCDFINAIPYMSKRRKGVTVQQYRSELFSRMFEQYVSKYHLEGVCNKVVVVEGVAEPYFFHIISRSEHLKFADMIAERHHEDFDK